MSGATFDRAKWAKPRGRTSGPVRKYTSNIPLNASPNGKRKCRFRSVWAFFAARLPLRTSLHCPCGRCFIAKQPTPPVFWGPPPLKGVLPRVAQASAWPMLVFEPSPLALSRCTRHGQYSCAVSSCRPSVVWLGPACKRASVACENPCLRLRCWQRSDHMRGHDPIRQIGPGPPNSDFQPQLGAETSRPEP